MYYRERIVTMRSLLAKFLKVIYIIPLFLVFRMILNFLLIYIMINDIVKVLTMLK